MPASRNKRKRSEIDQGKVPSATARRGSSKSSSGNELKRAKNEAKKETEPVAVNGPAEPPFKSAVSHSQQEENELTQRNKPLTVEAESSENIAPTEQPQSCPVIDANPNNDNNSLERQHSEFQSMNENSHASEDDAHLLSNGGHSRLSRLNAAINHRKLLLKRIRQCESAANGRLSSVILLETEQKGVEPRINVSSATDELGFVQNSDEVEYFREVSRLAAQAAKRQRSEGLEGSGEHRPSVSLRRGASVGKRMNAALSSLAPGSIAALPDSAPFSSAVTSNTQAPPSSVSVAPKATSSQTVQATAIPQGSINLPFQQQPQPQLQQQPQPHHHQQQQLPQEPSSTPVGKMPQHSQPKEKTKRSGMKQPKISQSTTLSEQYAPSAHPLHQRAGGSTLPPNKLALPKIVCQETKTLREKRGTLRLKLSALLLAKSAPSKESGQNRHAVHQKQFQSLSSFESQKAPQDDQFNCDDADVDVGCPLRLPQRRKSHWDYVLDEMRWMATDFVEERKWKQSTARLLALASLSGTGSAGSLSVPQVAASDSATVELVAAPVGCKEKGKGTSDLVGNGQPTDSSCLPPDPVSQRSRLRQYDSPSLVESKPTQRVAKLVSSMPQLLSTALVESGALSATDLSIVDALHNGQKFSQKDISNEGVGEFADTMLRVGAHENGSSKKVASLSPKLLSEATSAFGKVADDLTDDSQVMSRDQIAQYVDELCSRVKSFGSVPSKRMKHTRIHDSLTFSPEQDQAIRFAEYVWSEIDSAGVVVGGPAFSGKTTISCSMFWKYRESGPQLLICSPSSVIRWEFEFSRFPGLRVLNLDLNAGISHHLSAVDLQPKFTQGDVVVCDYSFLTDSTRLDLSSFTGIAIDCRRPIGFSGSVGGTCSQRELDGAGEWLAVAWWERLLDKLPRGRVRRMLVDGTTSELLQNPRTPCTLVELELMALRTAFLLGPTTYRGSYSSYSRNVFSWVKHAARAIPDAGENKSERVWTVLSSAFLSFSYFFKSSPMRDVVVGSSWQQRQCALPKSQRSAYYSTCKEVRGILSMGLDEKITSLDDGDHFEDIVNSLFRLRRACVHANLERILSDINVVSRSPDLSTGMDQESEQTSLFDRRIRESASQPNLERAFRILVGSGKIRELASILKNDCGRQLAGDDVLSSLIPGIGPRKGSTQCKTKNSQPKKRRVVILAELPDVQLLVSLFLSSVGLQHDLLLRRGSKCAVNENVCNDDTERAALAWIEHQLCLFKFNSVDKEVRSSTCCAIVVGSPCSLGADHCGLGVQSADLIVSMDEDWSGRCQLVMRSIVAQSSVWNKIQRDSPGCTFIKLVARDTCEELFLSALTTLEGENCHFQLTTDSFGIVSDVQPTAPEDDREKRRLWNFRGQDLSKILCYQGDLPITLGAQAPRQFLPLGTNEYSVVNETEKECGLMRRLLQKGRRIFSKHLSFAGEINRGQQAEHPVGFLLVLPPMRLQHHTATRNDRHLLSSRLVLERCASLASRKQIAVDATSEAMVSSAVTNRDGFAIESGSNTDNSDLVDSWHKSGLSRPTDSAVSLLTYSSTVSPDDDGSMRASTTPTKVKFPSMEQKRSDRSSIATSTDLGQLRHSRINAFAGSYSVAAIDTPMRDGNQGFESAVYFPPIFPSLVFSTFRVNFDFPRLLMITSEDPDLSAVMQRDDLKRKQAELSSNATIPNSKRLKTQMSDSGDVAGGGSGVLPVAEQLMVHASTTPSQILYAGQTAYQAVAPPHPPIFGVQRQMNLSDRLVSERGSFEDAEIEYLRLLNEDFGLLGIGLLPPMHESTKAAGMVLMESSYSANDAECSGEYEANISFIPCDAEEAEKTVVSSSNSSPSNTVILFVVKPKQRVPVGAVGQPFRTAQGLVGELQWTALPSNLPPTTYTGGSNGTVGDVNGGAKKTGKKKSPGPLPPLGPSAFSRLPVPDLADKMRPPALPAATIAPNKDVYRNRMMLSPHVAQLLGKLFDVPSFRLASVRVRNRIADRASRLDRGSTERGHGLPMLEHSNLHLSSKVDSSFWISLARKLRNPTSQPGDDARALSLQQKAALRRSLVSPCRVDFGPFQSGFLAAPGGMTGISPPRSRVGVSLPMGVKVPQALREHNVPPWTAAEDRKLQLCAVRFGLNWVLASRCLTGLEDILVSSRRRSSPDDVVSSPRSARHCRDRWQALVKTQPALAKDVRKSERVLRERAAMASKDIPQFHQSVVRLQAHDDEGKVTARKNVAILVPVSALEGDGEDGTSAMLIDTETSTAQAEAKSQQPEGRPAGALSDDSRPRRTFAAYRNARLKKVVIPLAMPGLPSSGAGATLVASHQSHMQAVQTALSTSNPSSGRNELWPLQILELADKHRAAATRALAETIASTSTATRPSISHSQRSTTTSTIQHTSGGTRAISFPQVPLPQSQRSSSTKSGTISQPERLVAPSAGSPSRSPRKAAIPLPAQALPPPPMPHPPAPPPPSQHQQPPPAVPPQLSTAPQPSQPMLPPTQPTIPQPVQQHPTRQPPVSNPPFAGPKQGSTSGDQPPPINPT